MIRRLEGPELVSYDVLDPIDAKTVRVAKVPLLPRGADGMTIGSWVFLLNDEDRSGRRRLIAHELVHVRQYKEMGYLRFTARYLFDYARQLARHRRHRTAYLAIPAEVQARAEAEAWHERMIERTARPGRTGYEPTQ